MILQNNIYNIEESAVYFFSSFDSLQTINLDQAQIDFVKKIFIDEKDFLHLNLYYKSIFLIYVPTNKKYPININGIAKKIYSISKELSIKIVNIID